MRGGQDTTRFTYDSRGRVLTATDPQGHLVVQHTYGGVNGNLSKDSLPGNRVTTYLSDAYGRDTAVQRPGMALQRTIYDLLNRPIQVFDGVNPAPTVTAYDSLFIRSMTDPKGQVYRYTYNALGWLTARIDPSGRAEQYAYDRNANLKRWLNRRADSLVYVYDALNRRTNKSGSNTANESWTYSSDRRVITATSPVDTETAFLNVAGVPDSTRTKFAVQTYTRRYRYTIAGLRDSLDVSGGGIAFKSRKWVYDTALNTLSELHVGGAVTTIARDKDLQDTSITFPSGDRVRKQFYPLHNVTQISTAAPYNSTIARSVGFDALGRISEQVVGDGSSGKRYTYDGLSRVQSDSTVQNAAPSGTCSGNPPPIIDENGNSCVTPGGWQATAGTQFAYDSASNRRDQGGSYGAGNRILAFAGCGYTTDNDGNVISRTCGAQTVTFTWTAESRLASYTVGGQTVTLQYDALGTLVRKDVNGSPQSHFLWDGSDLLAELSSSGTAVLAEYSYYGPDRLHALFVGGQEYNAHADALGNVIALTDGAQTVKRTYVYDAWGNLTGGSDVRPFANADRPRFKGALWLGPELDVYYMRSRWYEPQSGRFLSEDPIGLAGGVNTFAFAAGDPVNRSDPQGRSSCFISIDAPCDGESSHFGFTDFPATGPMNWDEWFAENSALTPTLTPSVDELLDMAEAALAAGYDGVIWDANSGRIDEFTFSIYITGVFLTESGAFDSPVIRTGVRVLEKIFAVNRGQKMWLRERSLLGSFQLSTESWPFSYADEAVYKGTVWIQGYPPISVSGTVYRGINNGVFHRWP